MDGIRAADEGAAVCMKSFKMKLQATCENSYISTGLAKLHCGVLTTGDVVTGRFVVAVVVVEVLVVGGAYGKED